jgi:multiple sugar transport system permease protein
MSTEGSTVERQNRRSGPLRTIVNWPERLSETQYAYLLLTPVLLILGGIVFWPLAETFWTSLHADNLRTGGVGAFVGLDNYIALFAGTADLTRPFLDLSKPLKSAVTVTLIFTVVSVAFETIIGLGQALVLDQDFRGRRWARVAIILPWAVPIVIQGMIFYLMFRPGVGFAVEPLQQLGIFGTNPLNESSSALLIVIVADIWKTTAFMALLILAGLQSVDRSLYDVAKVAGASKWQQFRLITFPIILPTVLVAMLFRTVASMRIYGVIVASGVGCSTVPSLSCLVVETFRSYSRVATSAAIAFVTAAIIGIFVSVYIVGYVREGL